MGSGSLPTRADLDIMDAPWWNLFQAALSGDLVPRDSSAVATDLAANLGTAALRWKRMQVKSGYFSIGDIKYRNSYNGLTSPGAGWMLCDGRVINETNYDLEHGDGAWASEVVSSSIEGKYLPSLIARYAYGVSTTTQDGSVAITPVGNASHSINLEHNHQWYGNNGAGSADTVWNSSGASTTLSVVQFVTGEYWFWSTGPIGITTFGSAWTNNQRSTAEVVQPSSIESQPYMRII